MEAGKMELEEIEYDLRKLIEEVLELLARPAQQKVWNWAILRSAATAARPRRPPGCQVLVNLIGNAVKFTATGEVALYVTRAPASAGEDGFELCFEVDSGIGACRKKP